MRYRPDIDGLRAVAIVAVLLFHYGVGPFAGGFVGVDVFFVISGYLLTSVVRGDLDSGCFSLTRFYERRVRRIYPALIATFAGCLAIAFLLFPPLKMQIFGRTIIAASLFFSNTLFMKTTVEKGYFADELDKPILLHTWSLSIEEQFYLFLPILILITTRYLARANVAVIALILASSLLHGISLVGSAPNAAFFSLYARAWELLAGVLAAHLDLPLLARRGAREALAVLGLSGILIAIFAFDARTPFPGYNAIAPVGGAACLLVVGQHGRTLVGQALAWRPCVAIGKVSYSLYLWHWPILIAASLLLLRPLTGWERGVAMAAALLVAALSYRFVEQPFRTRRILPGRGALLSFGAVVTGAGVVGGLSLLASGGWPQRFPPAAVPLLAYNAALESDFEGDPIACLNFQKNVKALTDVEQCPLGAESAKKILFWGDSHMAQLYPAIRSLFDSNRLNGDGATFMMSAGCPPAPSLNIIDALYHCDTFSALALRRAQDDDVDIVFIMFTGSPFEAGDIPVMARIANGRRVEALSPAAAEDLFIEDLVASIDLLRAKGKRIVLALPQPQYDRPIPKLLNFNLLLGRYGMAYDPRRLDFTALRARLTALAARRGIALFDPREDLCPNGLCRYEIEGRALYRDNNHVPGRLSTLFEENLAATLRSVR